MDINLAPSDPSTNFDTPDVITGQGNLIVVGSTTAITSTNVWITNEVASVVSGTRALTFTIQGGSDGVPYDTFVNPILDFSTNTNKAWTWEGQGYHGTTYMITNLPNTACFLILGTPQDTANSELTDAYQLLVSKTNPDVSDSDLDGLLTGWEILLGLNPHINNVSNPSERYNYGYTLNDWLNSITGIKTGSVSLDNEGNVLNVSQ